MSFISGLLSGKALRRLFPEPSGRALERRVLNLPVQNERRGPRCQHCGFGTLRTIPPGPPNAGRQYCDRPGCGFLSDAPMSAA